MNALRFVLALQLTLLVAACHGSGANGGRRNATKDDDAGAEFVGCACALDWQIDNLAVCVVRKTGFSPASVYSSHINEEGQVQCDPARTNPQPVPLDAWSTNRIKSACAGDGRLCVALRQGAVDADGGVSSSCTLIEHCQDVAYRTPDEAMELPPIAAWSVVDAECADHYDASMGFFEFRLDSETFSCGAETPSLISRRPSCPPGCDLEPANARTERCKVCNLCPTDCASGSTEPRCTRCGGSGNGVIASF